MLVRCVLITLGLMKKHVDVRCEEVFMGIENNAIIALYDRVSSENRRHRDYEWRITVWIVAIFFGIIYLVKEFNIAEGSTFIKPLLYFLVPAIAFWGIWMIWQAHKNGAKTRQVMRICETGLRVDELLHKDWRKPSSEISPCYEFRYVVAFYILIGVMGAATIFSTYKYISKETPCQSLKK